MVKGKECLYMIKRKLAHTSYQTNPPAKTPRCGFHQHTKTNERSLEARAKN